MNEPSDYEAKATQAAVSAMQFPGGNNSGVADGLAALAYAVLAVAVELRRGRGGEGNA